MISANLLFISRTLEYCSISAGHKPISYIFVSKQEAIKFVSLPMPWLAFKMLQSQEKHLFDELEHMYYKACMLSGFVGNIVSVVFVAQYIVAARGFVPQISHFK